MDAGKKKILIISLIALTVITVGGIVFFRNKKYGVKDPDKNNRFIKILTNK